MVSVTMRVLDLADPSAASAEVAGAKAANIAVAAGAGFPTAPGFVLTTGAVGAGVDDPEVLDALREAFDRLVDGAPVPPVVRSSSTIEDVGSSSMAGRFTSVLGVVGWDAFVPAVQRVISSAASVRHERGASHPIAVLVQRQLVARVGGVMFGIDPVTGATHHIVVEAVAGGPERLVGGTALADQYVLSRRGRIVRSTLTGGVPTLEVGERRALVAMARRARVVLLTPSTVATNLFVRHGGAWLLVVHHASPVMAR